MRISISFDPATDNQTDVAAAIARIYGTANSVTLAPADNPEAGEEVGTLAPTTNATGGVTLDSTGLRWDPRIHSTPAKFIANGTWRAKRGIDDATVAKVTAELRAAASGVVVVAATTSPAIVPAVPPAPVAPVAPAAPIAPPPPAAPVAPPSVYESFVNWIADHIKAGTMGVTEEWVSQVLTQYGIADGKVVNLQNAAPDLITSIRTAIAGALNVSAA